MLVEWKEELYVLLIINNPNKMKKLLIPIITIIAITLTFTSCKKDRIEPAEEPLNDYADVNDYFNNKKQPEQERTVDDTGQGPITFDQGTIVYLDSNCLRDPNNNPPTYPFKVYGVELYTPKDMIYWQMPTVAGGDILETDGEIRMRATTSSGQDLTLVCDYSFEMPSPTGTPNTDMDMYTGIDNGTFVDWQFNNTPFTFGPNNYQGSTGNFGWINADISRGSGSGNTLSFTSQTDILTNVGIFIYIPVYQTVMQVYNETSGLIPNGLSVKIIMIAVDGSGQLFSYTEDRTVNNSATIDMSLNQTTDADLTAHLDAL